MSIYDLGRKRKPTPKPLSSYDETRLGYAYEETKEQWGEIKELKIVVRMLSESVAKLLDALPTPEPPDPEAAPWQDKEE